MRPRAPRATRACSPPRRSPPRPQDVMFALAYLGRRAAERHAWRGGTSCAGARPELVKELPLASASPERSRPAGRRPQSAPAVRRAVPRVPRSRRRPARHGARERARVRRGAAARRGAGRARSREDGVLQQREPRVPHAAHAAARTARGRCWRDRRRRWRQCTASGRTSCIATRLRLLKLVNTLLDFSRIEAGRIDANYEPTDLAAFTTELASVFRSAVEQRRRSRSSSTARRCASPSTSIGTCGRRSS